MTCAGAQAQIRSALNILQQNASFARQMPKHNGLCWCPSMEKESQLQLNPNTDIRLKHPYLVNKVRAFAAALSFVDKTVLADQEYELYNQFKSGYPELLWYDLDDELMHYQRMMSEMDERDGISKTKHRRFSQWLANRYVLATTKIEEIPCTCRGDEEIALQQILPVGANSPEVICYNSCDRTLFAAFKRQMMRVYEPDPHIAQEFQQYTENYFSKYVEPVLRTFDYSYSEWFNKQPRHKQDDLVNSQNKIAADGYPKYVEYGLFCKREKQEAGGKNRAIANIEPVIKYIMGPVCWALEDVAGKYFPGYCGGKSWDDLENLFAEYYREGFHYVLQGDGSAFDTCQHYELKVIDRLIYQYISKNKMVHHVDADQFGRIACAKLRELNAKTFSKEGVRTLGSATIRGTVFSGASDTTLMNTLRMALYNMFTLERAGMKYGEDFKLLAKGDDFIVFSRTPQWQGVDFLHLYQQIWKPKPNHAKTNFRENRGALGMILKFLNVGDYDTIDFCSVTCIPYDDHTKFKLARKPNRMDPLAHFSRVALKMTKAQLKQYLIDQAYALQVSHGNMPFYRDYATALYNCARRIKQKAVMFKTGRKRLSIPDDGHMHRGYSPYEDQFIDYGHDFVEGMKFRFSTHTSEITDEEVEAHLLKHFGISAVDIEYHRDFLLHGGIYDCIADTA